MTTQGTSKTPAQLKIEEAAKRRAAKLKAFADSSATVREQSELKLAEIEETTGLYWGQDLGCVWLRTGEVVIVKRPSSLVYEKHSFKVGNGKDMAAKDVDEILEGSTLLHPNHGELELWVEREPDCKIAAANLAMALASQSQAQLAGKS